MQTWELGSGAEARAIVRATGVLPGARHDRAFRAVPRLAAALAADAGGRLQGLAVAAALTTAHLEPVGDMTSRDRALILRNLRGDRVLDADRHPEVRFDGTYDGDFAAGTLTGRLMLRGRLWPLRFDVRWRGAGNQRTAAATWQGTLADVGIEPFSALLGAIRLKDWLRIELDLPFSGR